MGNRSSVGKAVAPVLASPSCWKPLKQNARVSGDYVDVSSNTYHESMFDQGRYSPTTYSSCAWNEYAALRGRALAQTPVVDYEEVGKFSAWVKNNFRLLFPGVKKRHAVSLEQYLKVSNASPAVKAAVRRAGVKLADLGVGPDTVLSKSVLKRWTSRKAFVKVECNLYNSPLGVKDKAPRLIQGARPEFIALVGPAFVSIQNMIKSIWSTSFAVCFTSGVDALDIGQYMDIPGQVFENDVSSWDASICQQLCQLEVWLARKFGASRVVLDLMRANIDTHGRTTHGLKYSVPGTRKSGDPYTSLFNSILNGLLHLYCFCRGGVALTTVLELVRMCVQGDDNIMVHPKWMRPRFDLLLRLGFKGDCIRRSSLATAEFCSSRFYRHTGGWVLGPKFGRILTKFGHFVDLPKHLDRLGVLRGVACGYKHAANYVPGLNGLVHCILKLTAGHKEVYPSEFLKGEWQSIIPDGVVVDETSRISNLFWDYEYYGVDCRDISWPSKLFGGFGETADALYDRETSAPKCIFRG